MSAVLTFRRYLENGRTAHHYVVLVENFDPASNPEYEVAPGDRMTRFETVENQILTREYIRDRTNTGWVQTNHWDFIEGKPEEFTPAAHDFYGNRHFGKRPLPEEEHTLTNITHQQMMAIPLAFAL